ncbi:hypothetical protein [Gaoshiqia sp. Z1-71]|uniref:hypothetical protein n=1 Tax=Gaoshiqia hydrogeniformans TaxID=3290090 RepID=UPI003BF78088
MKQLFYLFLVLVLTGCEDNYEDAHRYSKLITQSKGYPVYLDMSEIGDIQVKTESPLAAPFKILSNDKYYFVGDMLKGMHVYEKKAEGVNYLCFIECRYIKDFELADNRLFCNNLVDLVVMDVSNPTEINMLHRQKNHFNRYTSYKEYWNIPYVEGKGLIVGTEMHELTGMITEKQPDLDFSEYDQLYSALTTKVIPDNWFSNHPEYDKPYLGMIKLNTDEIYAYGSYNSWSISNYRSGAFSVREEDLWTTPRGNYAPPYYYSNAFPVRMFFEDDIIYILGTLDNLSSGYCHCIIYNEDYPITYPLYFSGFKPLDICYMPQMDAFFVLTGTSVWGVFITGNGIPEFSKTDIDYPIATDAVEIFRAGDNLVTLGNELSVYSATESEFKLVKTYPGISGKCCYKEGNLLAVASTQGMFFYDITDLENIQLIP